MECLGHLLYTRHFSYLSSKHSAGVFNKLMSDKKIKKKNIYVSGEKVVI